MHAKNILVIGKYYPPFRGGIETNTAQVCEALAAAGMTVTALVNNHEAGMRTDVIKGVTVIRRKVHLHLARQPISLSLLRGVDLGRFDVVHLHAPNPFAAALLALKLLTTRRRPALYITHHMEIFGRSLLRALTLPVYRFLVNRSAGVIVTSMKNARISRDLPPGSPVVAIPLGIDLADYVMSGTEQAAALAWRRSLAGGAPTIGFVGRHARYKGLEVLLRALEHLPDAHAFIAGDGPMRVELEAAAQAAGIAGRAHFLGEVSHADKLKLLAASDVFAFPSVEITEAFGISQLEAMALGVPVVAADLPTGVTDVSVDGVTALLAKVGDSGDLAAQIRRLLENPALAASLSAEARRRLGSVFTGEVVAAEACAVLTGPAPAR